MRTGARRDTLRTGARRVDAVVLRVFVLRVFILGAADVKEPLTIVFSSVDILYQNLDILCSVTVLKTKMK